MNQTILAIDIGSNNITAVIAKNSFENKINILGAGVESSKGINKGLVTNIALAAHSIKGAVATAKSITNEPIDSTVVSISGSYTKGVRSSGLVNVPNSIITENEINQVLQMALYNATIVPEYDVIHVLPIYFKVDDSSFLDNPLDMTGSRLEVSVYIVTAKKTALTNIKSALKESNLEVSNFVLSGYASSMAVIDEEQKRFGVGVLDIGASTTDFVYFKGKTIVYNDFLPVGSNHITNDLSLMLHTPPSAAEELKIKYGSLLPINSENDQGIRKVKVPIIGDEQNQKEIPLESIQTIIHARVEEILVLMKDKIKRSGVAGNMGAGIIITGGASGIDGLKELASKVFDNQPVKIAKPQNLKNGFMDFSDPTMSTIIGLVSYGLNVKPSFELDSNKVLRKKQKVVPQRRPDEKNIKNESSHKEMDLNNIREDNISGPILPTISEKDKKNSVVGGFWRKVAEWF